VFRVCTRTGPEICGGVKGRGFIGLMAHGFTRSNKIAPGKMDNNIAFATLVARSEFILTIFNT
jgi:hypothetical protein